MSPVTARWLMLVFVVQRAAAFHSSVRYVPTTATPLSLHGRVGGVDRIHRRNVAWTRNDAQSRERPMSLLSVKPSNIDSTTTFSPMPLVAGGGSSSSSSEEAGKWASRFILLVVSAFYGTNFGCVKILNDSLDPSVSAVSRFTLASLVFLPFVLRVYKSKPQLVKGGLEVGAYNALG